MIKKLRPNHEEFAKVANFILACEISLLKNKWLLRCGNVLILLLISYTILGASYIYWLSEDVIFCWITAQVKNINCLLNT